MQIITFASFIAMALPSPVLAPILLNHSHYNFFLLQFHPQTVTTIVFGAYPLGVFLGCLLLGFISDKINKKRLLIVTLFMSSFFQLLSGYYVATNQILLLIITRFISGIFEGNIVIARSVVANLCPTENERVSAFGKINASLTMGWIIGPLLGAFLSSYTSRHYLPFLASTIICIFALLIVIFYFRFSATLQSTKQQEIAEANTPAHLIIILIITSFVLTMGIDCFYQFLPIYLAGALSSSPTKIACATIITGIFSSITNIFFTKKMSKIFNTKDIILFGSIILSTCLILISQTFLNISIYYLLPFIGSCIAITGTTLSTVISMRTPNNKQGKLMGFLLSSRSLGAALICFTLAPAISYSYKLPFMVGALLIIISLLALQKIWKNLSREIS